jgi:tetratricopeptide (TPR) repeat protein
LPFHLKRQSFRPGYIRHQKSAGSDIATTIIIHLLQPVAPWDDYIKASTLWAGIWAVIAGGCLTAIVSVGNIERQKSAGLEVEKKKSELAQQSEDRKRRYEAFGRLDALATKCYPLLDRLQDNSYHYPEAEVNEVLGEMELAKSEFNSLKWPAYEEAWEQFLQKAIFVHAGATKLIRETSPIRKPDFRSYYGQAATGVALGRYKRALEELGKASDKNLG